MNIYNYISNSLKNLHTMVPTSLKRIKYTSIQLYYCTFRPNQQP